MADTFEYSGDYEWALWREGVLCTACVTSDGTETKAIGVNCAAYGGLTVSEPAEIHVTPVCEEHARGAEVIRFPNEEDN